MLYKLTLENFGAIREQQTLDLSISGKVEEEADRQLRHGDIRTPRVSVIVGANASGKTTVLKAISFLTDFVTRSAINPQGRHLNVLPYWGPGARDEDTRLSVEFYADWLAPSAPVPFRYTLDITAGRQPWERWMKREQLDFKPSSHWASLIDATPDGALLRRDFQRLAGAVPATALARRNVSVISLLLNFAPQDPLVASLARTLSSVFTNLVAGQRDQAKFEAVAEVYANQPESLAALNTMVRRADLGITRVTTADYPSSEPEKKTWVLFFEHGGLGGSLPAIHESRGTMNFVSIFPTLHSTLSAGGLALMDELDSDLHPELLKEIVGWFNDPEMNKLGAQLITTCNNPAILDYLRKDEIFFASKNDQGATSVYGLKDLPKVRRDANFQREYLAGRYGAIPHIG